MGGLKYLLLLALLFCAGQSQAADQYELNPHNADCIVNMSWGNLDNECAPRCEPWGVGEVGRFGAFDIGAEGRIYIADEKSNTVKVFEPDGEFVASIPMQVKRNLVDDLVVSSGKIFWLREWPGQPMKVYFVDPEAEGFGEIEVSLNPDLTSDSLGRSYSQNCSLVRESQNVVLYARQGAFSIPLFKNGAITPKEQQFRGKKFGFQTGNSRIGQIKEEAQTISGMNAAPGDIVQFDDKEEILGVVAGNPGFLHDVSGSYFLVSRMMKVQNEWNPYWVLFNAEGEELSRTRMPSRADGMNIDIPHNVKLAPDGSFFELTVDQNGVSVCKYEFPGEK